MSDNPRPRWQIYIGYRDDGNIRYYFQDTDPPFRQPGQRIGIVLLFVGRNFYYKLKAHDAIEYCRDLNVKDYRLP
jgi:hypothetical protein